MARGRFITLEGGEGAGKSTQAVRLAERLLSADIDAIVTREPGGTPGAEAIRGLLVTGEVGRWDALTEALLVNAARADHVARRVRPALDSGCWVICDRYVDSTLAYQGAGKGVPAATLLALHATATGDLWPDLTLVLQLPPGAGLARVSDPGRFEAHGVDFHARVAAHFAGLAGERFGGIDASGSIAEVEARIWDAVTPLLRC